MGLLVEGRWQDQWYDTEATGGRFERSEAVFRHWITPDGSPPGAAGSQTSQACDPDAGNNADAAIDSDTGTDITAGFKAEAGRYHLYASYACPWVHRVLIYRSLKGLESMIDVSFVHWLMGENGWSFQSEDEGIVADRLFDSDFMYQIYQKADPQFTGRVTVPVLWDKQRKTIVSNESADIIRMLNSAFDDLGATVGDYYPEVHREAIDAINDRVYNTLNNGVYKCGFATSQKAYDEAVVPLFDTLEWLESRLGKQRFLCGDQPLEADWRLLPTLLRFDLVYHGHFKCNLKRLVDYPNLWAYTRDLYQWPGISSTCHFEHAKLHYLKSHESVNPHRIVPIGPALDFDEPHGREQLTTGT